jgi:hypothetical protein
MLLKPDGLKGRIADGGVISFSTINTRIFAL